MSDEPVVHGYIAEGSTAPCGREWRKSTKDGPGDGMTGSWRFITCPECLRLPAVREGLRGQMELGK